MLVFAASGVTAVIGLASGVNRPATLEVIAIAAGGIVVGLGIPTIIEARKCSALRKEIADSGIVISTTFPKTGLRTEIEVRTATPGAFSLSLDQATRSSDANITSDDPGIETSP